MKTKRFYQLKNGDEFKYQGKYYVKYSFLDRTYPGYLYGAMFLFTWPFVKVEIEE